MADMTPQMLATSIMGKVYEVLTTGDEHVPKSEDNFFTWASPGIPVDPSDFDFLSQGLSGVVKGSDGAAANPAPAGGEPASKPELAQEDLDRLLATDTNRMYLQAENLARLVDFVPDVTRAGDGRFAQLNILNNEGTLSEIYERVLRMSQVMKKELPEETTKKIEKFRGLLAVTVQKKNLVTDEVVDTQEASPLVKAYNEKLAAYLSAVLEYNTRRIDALSASSPRAVHDFALNASIYRSKVNAAKSDWISNGFKNEYEQIAAFIDQVSARDLTLLKAQYKDDLERAKLTGLFSGSDFYSVSLAPANFMKSSGWTKFSMESADLTRHSQFDFSSHGWKASASGGFLGVFGASGGGSASTARTESNSTFKSESFHMGFEICQVPIVRPWFRPSFLNSKTWRFDENDPEAKLEMISDGATPPKGLMPGYPTSIIFVRKLVLTLGKSEGFSKFLDEQRSSSKRGGGGLSIGPFFGGGSASHYSKQGNTQRDWGLSKDNESISFEGAQIVGFKVHVMPKSPDPLATITDWV